MRDSRFEARLKNAKPRLIGTVAGTGEHRIRATRQVLEVVAGRTIRPDTVFVNGSSQESVQTWGFRGGYTHNWDPFWNTSIYGAYAGVRFGNLAKSTICSTAGFFSTSATGIGATPATNACNPDFNIAQAGIITRWTPVKNLTFSADLNWTHLDQNYSGNITLPTPTSSPAGAIVATPGKPAATYQLKDQDSVVLLLRAQRNW